MVVPRLMQSVLAGKVRSAIGSGAVSLSGPAYLMQLALGVALLGMCVWVIVLRLAHLPNRGRAPLVLTLLPWAYMLLRDLFVPVRPQLAVWFYPFLFVAIWALQPRLKVLAMVGRLTGWVAGLCIALAILLPSSGLMFSGNGDVITVDKQILPWGILVGMFGQGNSLGQFLVLGLPAVFLIPRQFTRYVFVMLTVFALTWSASRGAFVAGGIALVAVGITAWTPRPGRRVVVGLCSIVMLAVVVMLPFLTTDLEAFTNRGLIWIYSIRWWQDAPWTGLGSNWYSVVGGTSARLAGSAFHAHNQAIQLLVTGGVVLAALALLQFSVLTTSVARLAETGRLVGVGYLMTLGGTFVLERTLTYTDNTGMLPTVLVPIALLLFAHEHQVAYRGEDNSRYGGNLGHQVEGLAPVLLHVPSNQRLQQSDRGRDISLAAGAQRWLVPERAPNGPTQSPPDSHTGVEQQRTTNTDATTR
ncbi:hypothetical protein ABIB25_005619 [Nakamurella sp. UYEF19]|uniref:O-antigen ligase family protein n=1 Tax=Nakamurella sp. UYEF19 TaxID=1756392 RepID=UPI0033960755